jgi:hypothetical protein
MEFQFQKDFIFRKATASDRGEALALFQKYANLPAEKSSASETENELGAALASSPQFVQLLAQKDDLFLVALNLNGVMIGYLYCRQLEWRELVVNPNFMKKEVKEALLGEVKKWASAHAQNFIWLKPKLITGGWKAFVKNAGCKIDNAGSGKEKLIFPASR